METLKRSILAGMMIGIGSTVYLALDNKALGAALFTIGLFMICAFGMYLFTGKIGYVIKNKNTPNCLVIWAGNLIGSSCVSIMVRLAKPQMQAAAAAVVAAKLQLGFLPVALLSILCGFLMFLAVDNYARRPDTLSGILGLFLCVITFILSGFEHSIADMCYCAMAVSTPAEALKALVFILIVSVFNGLGAIFMYWMTAQGAKKGADK